jgi:dihydropteroate synthase
VATLLRLELPDRPGSLAVVARVLGGCGVNILGIDVLETGEDTAVDDFLLAGGDLERALAELGPYVRVVRREEVAQHYSDEAARDAIERTSGRTTEELLERPAVMGILNVTPDSFSDGGVHFSPSRAIEAARRMLIDGAALVDVGGESTRPGSTPVPLDEELRRVMPVLEGLAGVPVSIDTSKADVARRAIELGALLVNDVTALRGDASMAGVVAGSEAWLCLMHMRGQPATMQDDPVYADVVSEVRAFLEERLDFAVAAGIPEERICLDPGIGFGKSNEHNLDLIRQLDRFVELGRPVLVGLSRKRTFAGLVLGETATVGTPGASVGAAIAAFANGAAIFRVHDVRLHVEALAAAAACER